MRERARDLSFLPPGDAAAAAAVALALAHVGDIQFGSLHRRALESSEIIRGKVLYLRASALR